MKSHFIATKWNATELSKPTRNTYNSNATNTQSHINLTVKNVWKIVLLVVIVCIDVLIWIECMYEWMHDKYNNNNKSNRKKG